MYCVVLVELVLLEYKKNKNCSLEKLGEDGGAGTRSGFTGLSENSLLFPSQDKLGRNTILV